MTRSYRVSDSLGSLLETYVVDGLDDDDEPSMARARGAVVAGWNRATDRLVIDAADARDLTAALDWALDSLADEKPHPVGTGRIVVNLHRSGMALMNGLLRQLRDARTVTP